MLDITQQSFIISDKILILIFLWNKFVSEWLQSSIDKTARDINGCHAILSAVKRDQLLMKNHENKRKKDYRIHHVALCHLFISAFEALIKVLFASVVFYVS